MKKLKVKVCGMRNAENIELLAALKPDYMGFIFYSKSPRFAEVDQLKVIFEELTNQLVGIEKVGVFVNMPVKEVTAIAKTLHLNVVQLHGSESPQEVEAIKNAGFKVWKVFSVEETLPLEAMYSYASLVDAFLLDTKTSAYGGSGQRFNWQALSQYKSKVPLILSGGIGAENIEEIKALKLPQLTAIDLNSRFELVPGLKDVDQLHTFLSTLRKDITNEYTR